MARPKEPRIVDGVELVENLYQDTRKRKGKFRYRKKDGSFVGLPGEVTPQKANRIATLCNERADDMPVEIPDEHQHQAAWGELINRYIAWREAMNPQLVGADNWRNLGYALHAFGREFGNVGPHRISRPRIVEWWDRQSHHQQQKRHAELRKLFNWAMGENFCPQLAYNPFTLSDDRPRLYVKAKPEKKRSAITLPEFWETYDRARKMGYVGLQRAMAISLVTTMRQGDICKLRFDQVVDGQLRVVIGKSEAQRGAASATRLAWSLEAFPLLRNVIIEAREDSLAARRCPFIVYHVPLRVRDYHRKTAKAHPFQMKPDLVQKQFAKVRPDRSNPPTFHEIRGLSSVIFRRLGHDTKLIQELMAHTDEATTLAYQDYADLPFKEVKLSLTTEDIGGKF
jgi:integrase